jgi:hypothetical protein
MNWLEVIEGSWIIPVGSRVSVASETVYETVVETGEAETKRY